MTFLDPLTEAKRFATHHHVTVNSQTYGVLPYTHHLADVEAVMRNFGVTEETMLIAAWLHDILEDCPEVKPKHIEEMFNDERLINMLLAVTDEAGENRKVRKALTYPKIRHSQDARILKLADRIANVQAGGSLVQMYQREYEEFRLNLKPALADETDLRFLDHEYHMWVQLDVLLKWRLA